MLIKHGYERTLAEAEDDHMPVSTQFIRDRINPNWRCIITLNGLVIVADDAHMYRTGKRDHTSRASRA